MLILLEDGRVHVSRASRLTLLLFFVDGMLLLLLLADRHEVIDFLHGEYAAILASDLTAAKYPLYIVV